MRTTGAAQRTHAQRHADTVVLRRRLLEVAGIREELPELGQLFARLYQLVVEFQGGEQQPVVQQFFRYVAVARRPAVRHSGARRSRCGIFTGGDWWATGRPP